MTAEDKHHWCSYECERPECIRAQRDELVSRLEALTAAQQQRQPVAVDVAAAKRAVAEVMSAPDGISVEAFFRIVLEAAVAGQHKEPTA